MKNHEEIPIKVNAWVDKGVAALVEALNLFKGLETIDSCEGYDKESAYVYFRCCTGSRGKEPEKTCRFVQWLASILEKHPNSHFDYRLYMEWVSSSEPIAKIITHRDNISLLVEILRQNSKGATWCKSPLESKQEMDGG